MRFHAAYGVQPDRDALLLDLRDGHRHGGAGPAALFLALLLVGAAAGTVIGDHTPRGQHNHEKDAEDKTLGRTETGSHRYSRERDCTKVKKPRGKNLRQNPLLCKELVDCFAFSDEVIDGAADHHLCGPRAGVVV